MLDRNARSLLGLLLLSACGDSGRDTLLDDAGSMGTDGDVPALDAAATLDAGLEADAAAPLHPYEVCSADGWCFARPIPTDRALYAAAFVGGQTLLAGDHGTLLAATTDGVRGLDPSLRETVRGAFAIDATHTFLVGDQSTLLRFDGHDVQADSIAMDADAGAPAALSFNAVWASSANDAWAVGAQGLMVHFDGNTWVQTTAATGSTLRAVFGFAPDSIFAVGDAGVLVRFDGSLWTPTTLPGAHRMNAIHGSDASDVWAVGEAGNVLHFDGTTFTAVDLTLPKTDLTAVLRVADDELWVAGSNGSLYLYDGKAWHQKVTGTTVTFRALSRADDGSVWCAGDDGVVQRWLGDERTVVGKGASANLLDAFGADTGRLWLVGDSTFTLENGTFTEVALPTARSLYGGAAVSDKLAWLVGTDGTILRWDGSVLRELVSGTTRLLRAVWAPSASAAWIVGEQGTLLGLINGTSFIGFTTPAHGDLFDVWGSALDDGWAVGNQGFAMHWDGTTWTAIDTGTTASLRGVWGSASDDVWSVGTLGTLAHWNGKAFSVTTQGDGFTLYGVWGDAADDVYAVGSAGTVLHYDGTIWSEQSTPTGATLFAVTRGEDGVVRAVGERGVVLYKRTP